LSEETGKFSTAFKPGTANYILTAGYLFRLTDNFELLPTILLKSNPANDSQADINCSVIYREKVWVGTSIRTNGNLSTLLQLQINSQLRLGYSYGYELSELSSYQKGSHEVMLLYNFRYTLDVVNPRYF
jgi:type IX secretion system PorP/SprF family membrane protein